MPEGLGTKVKLSGGKEGGREVRIAGVPEEGDPHEL